MGLWVGDLYKSRLTDFSLLITRSDVGTRLQYHYPNVYLIIKKTTKPPLPSLVSVSTPHTQKTKLAENKNRNRKNDKFEDFYLELVPNNSFFPQLAISKTSNIALNSPPQLGCSPARRHDAEEPMEMTVDRSPDEESAFKSTSLSIRLKRPLTMRSLLTSFLFKSSFSNSNLAMWDL